MEVIKSDVLGLLRQSRPFPDKPLPSGTNDSAMDAFGNRTGVPIPEELRLWLRLCNGAVIGLGGVYGLLEMEEHFEWHPEWKQKGWIAIAGDGCGDSYVLDSRTVVGSTHPVYFLDHEIYEGEADYIVASGLWTFLRFLLGDDCERQESRRRSVKHQSYWPFDAARVLVEDPALAEYRGDVPLPWKTR